METRRFQSMYLYFNMYALHGCPSLFYIHITLFYNQWLAFKFSFTFKIYIYGVFFSKFKIKEDTGISNVVLTF